MDEFAAVLRAWRDRLSPREAGLPPGTGRRAPGLRREELAALAGVSVEYLVRLEQGRARHPSPQLLGALARALRLTEDERDHLYRLGGVAVPSDGVVSQHITPGVQRSSDLVADLGEAAGRYPRDPGLTTLVSRLRAESPDFRQRWGEAHIARHRSSRKTATATPVGPIAIDCDVLTAPGTDLRIVIYTVVPGSQDASKLELLKVAGTQALSFLR